MSILAKKLSNFYHFKKDRRFLKKNIEKPDLRRFKAIQTILGRFNSGFLSHYPYILRISITIFDNIQYLIFKGAAGIQNRPGRHFTLKNNPYFNPAHVLTHPIFRYSFCYSFCRIFQPNPYFNPAHVPLQLMIHLLTHVMIHLLTHPMFQPIPPFDTSSVTCFDTTIF